eukprot:3720666-Pleurochrysis_carterae.AAC.5
MERRLHTNLECIANKKSSLLSEIWPALPPTFSQRRRSVCALLGIAPLCWLILIRVLLGDGKHAGNCAPSGFTSIRRGTCGAESVSLDVAAGDC